MKRRLAFTNDGLWNTVGGFGDGPCDRSCTEDIGQFLFDREEVPLEIESAPPGQTEIEQHHRLHVVHGRFEDELHLPTVLR